MFSLIVYDRVLIILHATMENHHHHVMLYITSLPKLSAGTQYVLYTIHRSVICLILFCSITSVMVIVCMWVWALTTTQYKVRQLLAWWLKWIRFILGCCCFLPNISLSCSNIIPYYIESHRQTRKPLLLIFNNYLLGY